MIKLRKSAERGHFNHGWLNTYHTFSFGRYMDRDHVGYHSLRVINEDFVAANQGFGEHPHDNMEIITYVISGELKHQDSMGNGSIIKAGEFQQMSAGTGVFHSEFNPSETSPVHLYQIWIEPDRRNYEPSYDQKSFAGNLNELTLIATKKIQQENVIKINQDANIYFVRMTEGAKVELPVSLNRYGWIQIISGSLKVNQLEAKAGDGFAVSEELEVTVNADSAGEILFFDLP